MKLHELPNISTVNEQKLKKIGIKTAEELRRTGSKEAFVKLRVQDEGACLHLLYALEGAVRGIPKKDLPEETKEELRQFHKAFNKQR